MYQMTLNREFYWLYPASTIMFKVSTDETRLITYMVSALKAPFIGPPLMKDPMKSLFSVCLSFCLSVRSFS